MLTLHSWPATVLGVGMMLKRLRKALSEDTADGSGGIEKRRHARRSVLLRATVFPIDVYTDVIVRDISERGLMGEADIELSVGQLLHLSFDEKAYHTGSVRWTKGRRFGLALNSELRGTLVPSDLDHGSEDGHMPRARRLSLAIPARLSTGRPPRPATVRNLSQSGMLLDTSSGLLTGQHVLIQLGNRPLIAARVQWSDGGKIGVKSVEPIPTLSLVYADD